MYDPLFVPPVESGLLSLEGVRFHAVHSKNYRSPDDMLDEPLHIHGYTEIFFHLAGDVSFFVNGRLHSVSSGDVILSRAGEIHRCICSKRECLTITASG